MTIALENLKKLLVSQSANNDLSILSSSNCIVSSSNYIKLSSDNCNNSPTWVDPNNETIQIRVNEEIVKIVEKRAAEILDHKEFIKKLMNEPEQD